MERKIIILVLTLLILVMADSKVKAEGKLYTGMEKVIAIDGTSH